MCVCFIVRAAVRMARVFWPSHDHGFLPLSLTRVPFNNITVDLDTAVHYIQVCYVIIWYASNGLAGMLGLGLGVAISLRTASKSLALA